MRRYIAACAAAVAAVAAALFGVHAATAATLKPVPTGLYVRNGIPATAQPAISHTFLNVQWSDLEPSRGQFNWAPIDNVINDPRVEGARIRLFSGDDAPGWVKNDAGPCVNVTLRTMTGCVPRYWQDAYLDDYQAFMQALADRYDGNPKILDVLNSACMTINDEPFIKGDGNTGANLYAAGDNDANEHKCMTRSMTDQMAAFTHTRVSISGHLVWQIPSSGGMSRSWPEERDILNQWRDTYGAKFIPQDNGVGPGKVSCDQSNPTTQNADEFWCWMKAVAPPKGGQMGCVGGASNTDCTQQQVLDLAVQFGLCYMEHAAWGELSDAQAASYESKLAANCGSVTEPPPASEPPTSPPPTSEPPPSGGPPAVTAGPVDVDGTTATVHCQVNPEGADTQTWIKYEQGATLDTGMIRVPAAGGHDIGAGTDVVDDTFTLDGLTAGADYAYRCSAQSTAGFTRDDGSFTAATPPPSTTPPSTSPPPSSSPVSDGTATPGTTTATVTCLYNLPAGDTAHGWVKYGVGSPNTPSTHADVSGKDSQAYTLTGLTSGKTYTWSCTALDNTTGDLYNADNQTFTTS